jgi:hypothetical protein
MYDKQGAIMRQTLYAKGVIKKELFSTTKSTMPTVGYKKAFLIGIEKYAKPQDYTIAATNKKYKQMQDLDGMVNDVNLIKNVLVSFQGFRAENVQLLTNEKATRYEILENLTKFSSTLVKDDIVYLHFSACNSAWLIPESFIFSTDYYKSATDDVNKYWITTNEIEKIFSNIRKKIGNHGQLVVSYDVGGNGVDRDEKKDLAADSVKFRGESTGVLFSSSASAQNSQVPFLFISGTSKNEVAYEQRDANGKAYGLFSYNLAQVLKYPYPLTGENLIDEIKFTVKNQTPTSYSNFPQFLFEQNQGETEQNHIASQNASLPEIAPKGNTHVISVGISKYPKLAKLSFENCVPPMRRPTMTYFTDQYTSLAGNWKSSFLIC